ncbi:DNA topoisomerase IB [Chitinophaga oryzae]|uniref:DNA topoisomerase n=1 Tax=Chitinophaga oryzae TaxID=2725414 RepID=A0AAE6ZJ69_9BACT|nr:DNA topoisomerase IB [Chitinophaga oryzae]QJB34206.1 DNA topoisomerase IB [Chitinophaga oryzae]QJB40727.1 DNA topoisomerase IB [Chitinophaga oryzae]
MDNTAIITDPVAVARAVKLRYVKAGAPGYSRERTKNGDFVYKDEHGAVITDDTVLERIRKLVLPPAWENVWISKWANGHLQATGLDVKGRKQYRYHTTWSQVRNETKYDRLRYFGALLPAIRRQIQQDLHGSQLNKEKVIAIALAVMEETLIRVGNSAYEKLYGSHGLTTLRNKHVTINGSAAFFQFSGKKGVAHKIQLRHAALTRLLKKVRDIPGHELFQYYDDNGETHALDSGEINDYLKQCTGEDFTCKDFRTWAGTVHALNLLAELEDFTSVTACKRNVVGIIDTVAAKLGNTRAVCRKYYIHPQLLNDYENGTLEPWLKKIRLQRKQPANSDGLHADEKVLLDYLKQLAKQ